MKKAFLIFFIVAVMLLMPSCSKTDDVVAPGNAESSDTASTGAQTNRAETAGTDTAGAGHEDNVQSGYAASWMAVTYIGDAHYSGWMGSTGVPGQTGDPGWIIPGEVIAVCQWNMPKRNRNPSESDNITVSSTVFAEGTDLYEWTGFDPSFRICGKDEWNGTMIGQQRDDDAFYDSLWKDEKTAAELYGDFTDSVNSIVIRGFNWGNEKGRIEDAAVIEHVLSVVLSLKYTEEARTTVEQARANAGNTIAINHTIVFQFANGFSEELLLFEGGCALFGGYLRLPDELVTILLDDAVVFTGEKISNNTLGRGYVSGSNYYDPDYDFTNHVLWEAYIDTLEGSALYISRYCGLASRYLVDPGPVSNLQRSGNYLYYLNDSGEIIRVMNSGVRDEAFLYVRLEDGGDIRDYLDFEVFYSNAVSSFQIFGRTIYYTDLDGTLYKEALSDMGSGAQQIAPLQIAEDVTQYAPDEDAVTYISGGSLYRAYPDRTLLLVADGVKCFAPAMSSVYYSKDGGVYHVSVAGGVSEHVFDLDASMLIYSTIGMPIGGFVCIEDATGACKIVFVPDEVHEFTVVESGAFGAGFFSDAYFLLFTDAEIYRVSFNSYWEKTNYGASWPAKYEIFLFDSKTDLLGNR